MIYFDCAATSLQKPDTVLAAVNRTMRRAASPGRGSHRPAMEAAEAVYRCREAAAELFRFSQPENIVLTFNATHGLNIAIKSLLQAGDTVLISGYEHNAVTRPLAAIPNLNVKVAQAPLFSPEQLLSRFDAMMENVDAVVCNHVSNVFGYILPAEQIAALCRMRGIPFILDASQSAGMLPIDAGRLGAAFLAMPGHKGLYGPQGTGLLLCGDKPARTLLEGGTGSLSARAEMPEFLPDRLEAGTHNVPGAAGLLEGIKYVKSRGEHAILAHERELLHAAVRGLSRIPGVRLFTSPREDCQSGVLSLQLEGWDCEEAGQTLGERGICVRSGLHCAPLAHKTAGTLEEGTVRVSFSAFNTHQEVDRLICEVRQLAARKRAK
jgi:cysteine desulfurase family protein